MRPISLAAVVVLACCVVAVAADPAADAAKKSSQRLMEIDQKVSELFRQGADPAQRSAALKQRKVDLRTLLDEIEAIAPEKMTADDHVTAATLYQLLALPEEALPHAEAALKLEPDNDENHLALVRALLSNKQLDAAETAFDKAIKQFPESQKIQSLRVPLYSFEMNEGSPSRAADHAIAYLAGARGQLLSGEPLQAPLYLRRVDEAIAALGRAERQPELATQLDSELAAVRELAAKGNAKLNWVAAELIARQVASLTAAGKKDEAAAVLTKELAAAQQAAKDHPDDADAALPAIPLLAAQVAMAEGEEALKKALDEYLAFLTEQTKLHADSADVIMACVQSPARVVSQLLAEDRTDAANSLLAAAKEFVKNVEPQGTAAEQALMMAQGSLTNIGRRMALEQSHSQLVGKDAFPLSPEAWVNGTPLTAEELKGKVVLLDFWAVWCGPCIATFPHLREWQEKFADKGLVIIGVTNYYKYGWNTTDQRSEPVEGITPEQEQAALVEFAKHHELKHRFAVMPAMSDFAEKYGVTGIPQVVVIDRQGKIRLIKVGSGPENAQAIEAMLERLLGDAQSPCEK